MLFPVIAPIIPLANNEESFADLLLLSDIFLKKDFCAPRKSCEMIGEVYNKKNNDREKMFSTLFIRLLCLM